jgi:hypothetical protein
MGVASLLAHESADGPGDVLSIAATGGISDRSDESVPPRNGRVTGSTKEGRAVHALGMGPTRDGIIGGDRSLLVSITVGDLCLVPPEGTIVLPTGDGDTSVVADLLRSLLWGCAWNVGTASVFVEICASRGATVGVENCDGKWRGRGCSLLHRDIMRLLNIEPEGLCVIERLPEDEGSDEAQGRCYVAAGHAMAVREIVEAVTGRRVSCGGNEVEGPLWLIDLSMRLAMGETVVFVNPGDRWEATVGILSGRCVQAFVIAPGGPALDAGFSVVSWPARDLGVPVAMNDVK